VAHPMQITSPEGLAMLERVRSLCSALPEVTEDLDGFGHTSFRVSDRPFVIMGEDQSGPELSVKADSVTQDVLVRSGRFSRTRFIGQHGWVSVVRGIEWDWTELEDLIVDGYRRVAPKRALAIMDD